MTASRLHCSFSAPASTGEWRVWWEWREVVVVVVVVVVVRG